MTAPGGAGTLSILGTTPIVRAWTTGFAHKVGALTLRGLRPSLRPSSVCVPPEWVEICAPARRPGVYLTAGSPPLLRSPGFSLRSQPTLCPKPLLRPGFLCACTQLTAPDRNIPLVGLASLALSGWFNADFHAGANFASIEFSEVPQLTMCSGAHTPPSHRSIVLISVDTGIGWTLTFPHKQRRTLDAQDSDHGCDGGTAGWGFRLRGLRPNLHVYRFALLRHRQSRRYQRAPCLRGARRDIRPEGRRRNRRRN